MKKLIAIISVIAVFGANSINAATSEFKKSSSETTQTELNILPYGKTGFVPMTSVFTNGEYTIYRAETDFINEIPSCQPVGKNYHYFVYKNGEFLMTVNECNKDKVFKHLTE